MWGEKEKKDLRTEKFQWQICENLPGFKCGLVAAGIEKKMQILEMQGTICQNGRGGPREIKTSVGGRLSTVIEGGERGKELVLAVCREGLQCGNT